ncbi:MAG: S41 family peptidase [Polaromonas sp.]|nr:S41 family peptidase [Polaromonas sp.]
MRRLLWLHALLALSSQLAAQPLEPSKSQVHRAAEIATVMSILAEDALEIFDFPTLFEICTQTSAPVAAFDGRKDFGIAYRPVLNHMTGLHLATDGEESAWSRQCLERLIKKSGPGSRYFTPEDIQAQGMFYVHGQGLVLTKLEGNWVVREASAGSPAAAAGVETGDVLLSLDGVQLTRLTNTQLSDVLDSIKKPEAQLVWQSRRTARVETRLVKRVLAPAASKVLVARMPDHLYMRIDRFDKDTKERFLEALRAAQTDSRTAKVLDLRGNPGGLLPPTHWLAGVLGQKPNSGDWLPVKYRRGSMLENTMLEGYLRGYRLMSGKISEPNETEARAWSEGPRWVVLIDDGTGSGAAWLAGVLKELNGAVLVGNTANTSNMSVHTVRPLGPNSAIRYETGRLILPSGKFLAAGELAADVPVGPDLNSIKPYPKNASEWSQDPMYQAVQNSLKR